MHYKCTRFYKIWIFLLGSLMGFSAFLTPSFCVSESKTADISLASASKNLELPLLKKAFIVPIEGIISDPQHFILRRALKQALEQQAILVVIKLSTPGGALNTTLEIMKTLDHYTGGIVAYVVDEALSAGAYIAASTDAIYMAPKSVIGAAAVIQGTGEDLPETARLKVESYIKAKIRMLHENQPFRGEVLRAMMDKDFELKIGDKIFKTKGELLTLTAEEAVQTYGTPPSSLFAADIFSDESQLLDHLLGKDQYRIQSFEVTWSERLAKGLSALAPLFIGAGALLLFMEFKAGTFGLLGIIGLVLLGIVFATNFIAGLAGNEIWIIFLLGSMLLAIEIYLFPGTLIFAVLGFFVILAILLWSMADIWPDQSIQDLPNLLYEPLKELGLGLVLAVIAAIVLARYLPKSWFWDRLILNTTVGKLDKAITGGAEYIDISSGDQPLASLPEIGTTGIAITDLHPTGHVEINGYRFLAHVEVGLLTKTSPIRVVGYSDFSLIVEAFVENQNSK